MVQHLSRTRSLVSETTTSPSILHGLGVTTSPPNNNTLELPIAEDHRPLAQLTMLPEDVEGTVQDKVSVVVPVLVSLARKTLMSTRRRHISGLCSQSWQVRRACIAIVCHRL